ncbi:alginate lyase family protein [candidate division KSB1 bacterium]|nr:alginate lyase family protein [candidate division KSB1 bacterium]
MKSFKRLFQLVKNYGLGFLLYRLNYVFERKTGLQKRKFKQKRWENIHLNEYFKGDIYSLLSAERIFFFTGSQLPLCNKSWHADIKSKAEEILQNRFFYFFNKSYSLGQSPDWFVNPVTGVRARSDVHWCEIKDFDPQVGDIKFIWEPSRFAWSYLLARAWAVTREKKYVVKFWELFEHWLEHNQPNTGANYYCGQECSLRLMAMVFAHFAFYDSPVSTDDRKIKLLKAIAVHAERIDKNIQYAVSTRTNHSLTESTGLYTVGLLFPEFKQSRRWKKSGKRILVREAMKQIFNDGAYIQHSMNYHRLMLQTVLWAIRLGQLNNETFVPTFIERVKKAVYFIYQMQDLQTGRVPNYGSNDGALIFPLNTCDYLDYRPVIQSLYYLFYHKKLYENGPWDEDLIWFFGEEAIKSMPANIRQKTSEFRDGGYYTIRGEKSWGMIRCHSYKTRPGQFDALHLDVWSQGINIMRDSGSFMYNCDPPWRHYFSGTPAHNTVTVDGENQMTRGDRFILFDWLQSSKPTISTKGNCTYFSGAHFGYKRLGDDIVHFRSVALTDDLNAWIIVDDIAGSGSHTLNLYWQITGKILQIKKNVGILEIENRIVYTYILSPTDFTINHYYGDEEIPAGFYSLYYGERYPASVINVKADRKLPVRLISVISPDKQLNLNYCDTSLTLSNDLGQQKQFILDRNPTLDKSVFEN